MNKLFLGKVVIALDYKTRVLNDKMDKINSFHIPKLVTE
jgi:hypothetical protein